MDLAALVSSRLTMTERCQAKFSEKFDSQINIIYVGILGISLAVLYFYRFHFATVLFSYVFGCVACYFALNSRILLNYMEQWKCHFNKIIVKEESQEEAIDGCETCGSRDCNRHESGLGPDPWVGLQIHKQLDLAIEDFYNTILEQFISSWYNKITVHPFFVDELRYQLRYASASLLRRALKIEYSRLITERLIPCALRHYMVCVTGEATSEAGAHPAVATRKHELRYLRALTDAIIPYLLKQNEQNNSVFHVLVRELFAGWVLLSLADVLSDPHTLNTLIVLATGGETMAQLPNQPNYKVEFLETFARQSETIYLQRPQLLRVDLDLLIADQEHLYAFMQFLRNTNHLQLLQFYKDIKSFQTRILNPELSPHEEASLHSSACEMYTRYFTSRALPSTLQPLAQELNELRGQPTSTVKRLQTSRALYQAARQSHAELEKIMLPKFLHSEEYYKLLIGSRIPTGYHKQMTRKPQDKLFHTAMRLGHRIKGALKAQALDGQVLDNSSFSHSQDTDGDNMDNVDILNYLDSLANDDSLREQDLSTCKVVLTNVETRLQPPPRRGTVRVFTVAVHRVAACPSGSGARLWTVERSEHDFHLLWGKLREFHGELLADNSLPSRRDNSPLETLRYKYEDFLQRLLQKSLLQTSELLHLFLTVDSDFSLVVQASALNANGTDLANMYQSVAHKLRKEKGQHLESFLKNLLVCSDMDRFQALKQGTAQVEEAQEVNEEIESEQILIKPHNGRSIRSTVFGNNLDLHCDITELSVRRLGVLQDVVKGFSQCLMYLLTKVIRARALVSSTVGRAVSLSAGVADTAVNWWLHAALGRLLTERRLAHLIRLGQGLLFGKRPHQTRTDPATQRTLAHKQLMAAVPPAAILVLGPGLPSAINTAFDIIQKPQLNKQLVYNLLDLCILELFPELSATEDKPK